MDKKTIEQILKTNNLAPLKSKGQNFLLDEDAARKIVSFLDPWFDAVLEIGPGLGALSRPLLLKANRATLVELDMGYVKYLETSLENVSVVEKDFLKYDVPRETTSVLSNLPYYITTKVIEKVLLKVPNLKVFVFMSEAGVKDRLLARPNTKDYSPLSILFKVSGTLEPKMTVTADKFYPVPHVDSMVFKYTRVPSDLPLATFYKFLKDIFLNRRKTLSNNLKRNYPENAVKDAYFALNLQDTVRGEELDEDTLVKLFYLLGGKSASLVK